MSFKQAARALTRRLRLRVRRGANQGRLWSLPTRGSFLRGVYEQVLSEHVASTLRPGDVFWDVGAHFGWYTLLGSGAVGSAGQVYAFEPALSNLWYLRHHVAWNRCANVEVKPVALGREDGERSFGGRGTGSGRLGMGNDRVQVRTLDGLVASGACRAPTYLKIDVQGAEAEVLEGAAQTLGRAPDAALVLATHAQFGVTLHADCLALLRRLGWRTWDSPERKLIVATVGTRPLVPPGAPRPGRGRR